MAEELENQTQIMEDPSQMYIDEIKQLKSNTVSKDAYQKLQEENRSLLKSLVEGQQVSTPVEEPTSRSMEEILKDFNSETSNLDHIKYVMELHNKNLERGVNDFVTNSSQYQATDEDIAAAKRVEDFFNDLIKTADGDTTVFNNEYQRRVVDPIIPKRK